MWPHVTITPENYGFLTAGLFAGGSLEKRVLVSARRFSDLGIASDGEDITPMETACTHVRKPSFGEESAPMETSQNHIVKNICGEENL